MGPDGPTYFSKQDFVQRGLDWAQFSTQAAANATAELATLQPRYERDRKKVIQYAELTSTRPIVT